MIYIICPVRNITEDQELEIKNYIEELKVKNEVHSYLDVDQDDAIGFNIVMSHKKAMEKCDEVHIFWDVRSSGSHMDLGMAVALNKKLMLIKSYQEDSSDKSYLKVIKKLCVKY